MKNSGSRCTTRYLPGVTAAGVRSNILTLPCIYPRKRGARRIRLLITRGPGSEFPQTRLPWLRRAPEASPGRPAAVRSFVPELQRLADPLPATRLVVYCPHQEGPRRVRQFGDVAGQLAVKVVRSVLLVMRPVPGDRHDRAVSAGQPHRNVSVIVQADARDVPRANDFGTFIIRDPHACHIHKCLLRLTFALRLQPPWAHGGSSCSGLGRVAAGQK